MMMSLSAKGGSASPTDGTDSRTEMSPAPSQPHPNFAQKLHYLLTCSEYKEIMQWNYLGDSFVILDTKRFLDTVMPRHFRRTNCISSQFDSFARRMRRWGFKRTDSPEEKRRGFVIFKSKLFRRDEPDLCKMMCDERKLRKKDGKDEDRVVHHAPVPVSRVKGINTNNGRIKPSSANVPGDNTEYLSSKHVNTKFSQHSLQVPSAAKSPAHHRVQNHSLLGTTHAVGHPHTTRLTHGTLQRLHFDRLVAAQEMNRSIPRVDASSYQLMDRYQPVHPNYWREASHLIVPEDRHDSYLGLSLTWQYLYDKTPFRRMQEDFSAGSRSSLLTALEYDMHQAMDYRHKTPVHRPDARSALYSCPPLASHEDTMISASSTLSLGRFHGKDARHHADLATRIEELSRAGPTPSYHRQGLGSNTHTFDALHRV